VTALEVIQIEMGPPRFDFPSAWLHGPTLDREIAKRSVSSKLRAMLTIPFIHSILTGQKPTEMDVRTSRGCLWTMVQIHTGQERFGLDRESLPDDRTFKITSGKTIRK
jgi:hypothetical protein